MNNVPPEEAPAYWNAGPRNRLLSNGLRADYHLPALLVIERRAFWPLLFANPAQQPFRLRQPFARLAREAHDIPTHADLVADPSAGSADLRDFDYALILEAGADKEHRRLCPALPDAAGARRLRRVVQGAARRSGMLNWTAAHEAPSIGGPQKAGGVGRSAEGIGDRGSQPWLAPALGQAAGASYQRSNRYRHGAGDTACQCGSAGRPNSADVPLNIVCVHCADQSFRVRLWSFSKRSRFRRLGDCVLCGDRRTDEGRRHGENAFSVPELRPGRWRAWPPDG